MNRILPHLLSVGAAALLGLHGIAEELPADLADMKVEDLRAGGDAQKRYFVIRRAAANPPKDGWRTLFVLPGGSGSAEFQPFVTRIAKNALPENYLVVQLVAPVWTPEQAKNVVWPTEQSNFPEMKFSTAEFLRAVRADVEKAHPLDGRHVFALTWSSSGINGYRFATDPKSGINGSFVAMSVFQPATLPDLAPVKGHPIYIYHSAQDFIPIAHAENARDSLQKAGAITRLKTYEGGHGWRGDVFGDIREGVAWLEEHATKR